MPKAILELEMPENCETCPIKRYLHYGWVEYICGITGEEIANKGRRSDCPLRLLERKGGKTPWKRLLSNTFATDAKKKSNNRLKTRRLLYNGYITHIIMD